MKRKSENINIVKTGITLVIVLVFLMPTITAIDPIEQSSKIKVDLGGPYTLGIGEVFENFQYNITGGVPPYSKTWYWGDGNSGPPITHVYEGNEPSVFNVALKVVDSEGNIGVGSTRVYTELTTDNNVFVDKYVKKPESDIWMERIIADVGDILEIKIVIETIGSDRVNLSVGDESSGELASDGNFSSTIPPDTYTFWPGGGDLGSAFLWEFNSIDPGTVIEITFEVEVIKEFSGWSPLEGLAYNGVMVYVWPDDSRIGPSGFYATDWDIILIQIREDPGTIFYVDDSGSGDFTNIQDAIDAASDGDTIIVYPGLYVEHVEVYKSLKLFGTRGAIIDGDVNVTNSSIAVKITGDRVTISGFIICNAFKSGIYIDSANNTITRNTVFNCGIEGIYLHSGDNNIVTNNKVLRNGLYGMTVLSNYNLIKNNLIARNQLGITMQGYANQIYKNSFMRNSEANAWDFDGRNDWTGYSHTEDRRVGNYWDDYNGEDADEDGLGDSPYVDIYNLPHPSVIIDLYPLMKPSWQVSIDQAVWRIPS